MHSPNVCDLTWNLFYFLIEKLYSIKIESFKPKKYNKKVHVTIIFMFMQIKLFLKGEKSYAFVLSNGNSAEISHDALLHVKTLFQTLICYGWH